MMPHATHNTMIYNGNVKGLVGPEGMRKPAGTALILQGFIAPCAPRLRTNRINGLRGECPTLTYLRRGGGNVFDRHIPYCNALHAMLYD